MDALTTAPPRFTALFGAACAGALLVGSLAGVHLLLPWLDGWPAPCLAALACIGWLVPWRWRALMLCVVGLGYGHWQAERALSAQLHGREDGSVVEVRGRIVGLPEHGARHSRFQMRVDDDVAAPRLRGRLLQLSWYDPRDARQPGPRMEVRGGARWQLSVRLRAVRGLVNPGGWDTERQALARGVVGNGVVKGHRGRELDAARGIDALRERLAARLQAQAPPEVGFLRALALGDTRGLDQSAWLALRATGLSHLVAISGFHVGVVAAGCGWLGALLLRLWPPAGRWLPRPQAMALCAGIGALGYAALAGFSLPTQRAVLMIMVMLLVRSLRRCVGPTLPLTAALVIVLLHDPLVVLLPGFWLSFAGVAWLLWSLPSAASTPRWRQALDAQGVATVGLLPLSIAWFGQASLPGPLINLVAIPWWSLVVVPLALLGLAAELAWEGAGRPLWWLAGHALQVSWKMFQWLAPPDIALRWFAGIDAAALVLASLGALWLLLPRPLPGRWLGALLWLPLLFPRQLHPAAGEVRLTVLDIGQGLAVLVQTQAHNLLYDAGPATPDGHDSGARIVVPALHALGVRRLSMLMLSHADADHAGGVGAVMAAVPVDDARVPPGVLLGRAGRCVAGQHWEWDGVAFMVLHPPPRQPYRGNPSSCVLRVEAGGQAILLTGDIGIAEEGRLLREQPGRLAAQVVVAGHHGSRTSSGPAWVGATAPRLVVFSAGHRNRFGHPHPQVVRRWQQGGAETVVTAHSGALQIWAGPDGLFLREWRRWLARRWDAAERDHMAAILSDEKRAAVRPED